MNGTLAMPEERHAGAQLVRPGAAVAPQHQIGDEDHPQQQARGEPRVPHPPDAPRLAGPERPGHERDHAEEHGHLRPCNGPGVRSGSRSRTGTSRSHTPDDDGREKEQPRRRHVEIEDLLHEPHRGLVRRAVDDPGRHGEHDGRDRQFELIGLGHVLNVDARIRHCSSPDQKIPSPKSRAHQAEITRSPDHESPDLTVITGSNVHSAA